MAHAGRTNVLIVGGVGCTSQLLSVVVVLRHSKQDRLTTRFVIRLAWCDVMYLVCVWRDLEQATSGCRR